ncbi:virion structural protein [Thermoproteus tenax spherical virus 1]|uniref:Uncharacterized protein n=1 Tax=Thermoproteus tenax spherical virus 1 TaxID=292639 RepID=Q647E2_9VIRU|nr:virion structural protein [Thermoproteus tenax spherical virus 1]AAU25970.1 hypothetical protein [Thermoproteus tenax spherical virus 1]
MIIPFSLGALAGLLIIAFFARRQIIFALVAIFISGALAGVAGSIYYSFMAMYLAALTIYIIVQEEGRIVERALALYLGTLAIWLSDNSAAASALSLIAYQLVMPLFQAINNVFVQAGIAFSGLLAWSIVARRIMTVAEEFPLIGAGYVYLAYSILAPMVMTLPDYLKLALGLALIGPFSQAVKGDLEALEEIAPFLWLLPIPIDTVKVIGAAVAIIELALGVLSKKRLLASAMWAEAILLA